MSEREPRESQLQRLLSSARQGVGRLGRQGRRTAHRASDRLSVAFTEQVAGLVSSLADPELLRWSGGLTHSAATVYERALDVEHLRAHLGSARRGVPELLSAGLGAVGLVFVLQRRDLEQLSELLGSMGITAILSANPLLGVCVVATTGYAYWQAQQRGGTLDRGSALRGAALAGSSAAVFRVLSGPAVLKLAVAIVVTGAVRRLTLPALARLRSLSPLSLGPLSLGPLPLGPVRASSSAPPSFRCDRELVEAMRL